MKKVRKDDIKTRGRNLKLKKSRKREREPNRKKRKEKKNTNREHLVREENRFTGRVNKEERHTPSNNKDTHF